MPNYDADTEVKTGVDLPIKSSIATMTISNTDAMVPSITMTIDAIINDKRLRLSINDDD